MTASAARKEFGRYIDTVQHQPVVITKQNRPVAITMSIQQFERLFKGQVEAGIAHGLQDLEEGRFCEMSAAHLENRCAQFKSRTS